MQGLTSRPRANINIFHVAMIDGHLRIILEEVEKQDKHEENIEYVRQKGSSWKII